MTGPPAAALEIAAGRGLSHLDGAAHEDVGLRCRVCGLDEVPWPRTVYCSERCRRRAAYLARVHRRRATAGRPDEARRSRETRR